jgi:MYXO-CTERM domain-containing protein
MWRIAACVAFALALGCSAPADPVELGTLCYPATATCGAQRIVTRGTVLGRNAIDLSLTNASSTEQTIEVAAGPPLLFEQEMGIDMPITAPDVDLGVTDVDMGAEDPLNPALDDLRGLLARRRYVMTPGQTVQARIVPNELGRQATVLLRVSCEGAGCAATLKYIVVVEPLECSEDGDCDGAQLCDVLRGQCVECVDGSQCLQGQRCELGKCTPPQVSSCQAAGPDGGPGGLWWLVCVLAALGARKRRKALRPALLALALVCAWPTVASAQEVRAGFSVGTGGYGLTGQMGEQSRVGIGLALGQELRARYLGLGVDLTAAYFVTEPVGASLSRELVLYSAQVGPRGYIPLGPVELAVGGGYERMGLAANSLAELTGLRSGYNGASGWAGVRLAQSLAMLEARVGYHYYSGLPGGMITITLSAGITD